MSKKKWDLKRYCELQLKRKHGKLDKDDKKELEDMAGTPHKGLPMRAEETENIQEMEDMCPECGAESIMFEEQEIEI